MALTAARMHAVTTRQPRGTRAPATTACLGGERGVAVAPAVPRARAAGRAAAAPAAAAAAAARRAPRPPRCRADNAGGEAGGAGREHPPIQLLIAQARASALEDFREAVAPLRSAAPGALTTPAVDVAAALRHVARLAAPWLERADVDAPLAELEAAARARLAHLVDTDSAGGAGGGGGGGGGAGGDAVDAAVASAAALIALAAAVADAGFAVDAEGDPFGHDPRNTFIDTVLQRRRGTPCALALLHVALAQRLGVPLAAWAAEAPGAGGETVLLKLQLGCGLGALLLDPAAGSPARVLLQPEDGQPLLLPLSGAAAVGAGAPGGWPLWAGVAVSVVDPRLAAALRPLSLRRLLGDALLALKRTYLLSGMREEALAVVRYARALEPFCANDLRDEGLLLAALGRHADARAPLATYLEAAAAQGGARDEADVRAALARVEAALAAEGARRERGGADQ